MFSTQSDTIVSPFVHIFDIISLFAEFEEPEIGVSDKGLNQFPSIVMFGLKGFHISASGAIQGRHGSLVLKCIHKYRGYAQDKNGTCAISPFPSMIFFPVLINFP